MIEMVNEMLKTGLDVVNAQKNLIAIIEDKVEADKFVDMLTELQLLVDDLERIYGDYVFSLIGYSDYHFIDINAYHITEDGIAYTVVKHIVNKELTTCDLFWIQPYSEGLTFKFHI